MTKVNDVLIISTSQPDATLRATLKGRSLNSDIFITPLSTAKKLPIAIVATLFGSMLLASSCSQSPDYEQSVAQESADYASEDVAMSDVASEQIASADIASNSESDNSKLTVENLVGDSEQTLGSQTADIQIKGKELLINASANFKVENVVKSISAIEKLTRQQNGYVAVSKTTNIETDSRTFIKGDQNVTLITYYRQATMTVRIPREKVNSFLKQVQQQVAFLHEQEFSAQDVTLDIYRQQLAAKLNSDMSTELSLERLNSKNAKEQSSNVDSITATYAARQQQEYARLEQMNIADKVKYSTIDLTFTQPNSSYKETTQNLEMIINAERPSFGAQVNEAFKEGWDMLRAVALGIIELWWLVVLFGVFYLIYRLIKALYRKIFGRRPIVSTAKRKEWFGEEKEVVVNKSADRKIMDDNDDRLS